MICSSVNLVRFIVRPQVGPDSNRIWRKNPGAGQSVTRSACIFFSVCRSLRDFPALVFSQPASFSAKGSIVLAQPGDDVVACRGCQLVIALGADHGIAARAIGENAEGVVTEPPGTRRTFLNTAPYRLESRE